MAHQRIVFTASPLSRSGRPARPQLEEAVQNVGSVDRVLRIVVGLVLLALVFVGPRTLWGLLGLVPLTTAFVRFCPLYRVLGIRTTPKPQPAGKAS
jgi:urea transporter